MTTEPRARKDPVGGQRPGGQASGGSDARIDGLTEVNGPAALSQSGPMMPAPLGGEPLMGLSPQVFFAPQPPALPPAPTDPAQAARLEAAEGIALVARNQFAAAVARFDQAVALRPAEAEYHWRLALAAESAGRNELVLPRLLEAVRLAPDAPLPHHALASWYDRNGDPAAALEHSARAVALAPDDPQFAVLLGALHLSGGTPREALAAIERFADPDAPGAADRWVADLYARIAPLVGRQDQALRVIERAMRNPNLPPGPSGKAMMHFAACALLDKTGRYDAAFEQAGLGNEAVRATARPHEPAAFTEWVSRKTRYFTRKRCRALPRATHESRRPVFILGMPRSGTSLVEQILACHPQMHAAGELNVLRQIASGVHAADWSDGVAYPECLDALSLGRANRLASQYLDAIQALDGGRATFVTDKQPLNYLILDLVELLFPGCHVIHCVRSALDTCLSCYTTNFERSNEFKLDLGHLGAYYRDYRRLMEHWKKVLTVPMLEVRYEDVVLDTEGQARRILEFLDLPWDDRCLRYYENQRHVGTASRDQVRRPIYTSSIGRWKHYEKHLEPLIAALGRTSAPVTVPVP